MPTELLYPTPVYTEQVNKLGIIQQEIDSAIDQVEFKNFKDTHLISEDSFRGDVISQYNLNTLKQEIDFHLSKYCRDLKFRTNTPWKQLEYTFQSSWFTKQEKGHYARMHSHGISDISGVYYYQTSGEDGHFEMNCPNVVMEATQCYQHIAMTTVCVPKVGMLKLFPSWLYHGIRTNTTDDTRISLSFNIEFKPE